MLKVPSDMLFKALQNFEYSLLIVLKWYWEAAVEDVLQKYLNMCSSK